MTSHQTSPGLTTGVLDVTHQVPHDEHTARRRRGQPRAAGSPIQPRPAEARAAGR